MTMLHTLDSMLSLSTLLAWQAKAAAVVVVALGLWWALRHASARLRRGVLAWGLLGAMALPLLAAGLGPQVGVVAPAPLELPSLAVALDATHTTATATTAVPVPSPSAIVAAEPASRSLPWASLLVAVWLCGMTIGALRVVAGLAGGVLLRRKAVAPDARLAAIHRDACTRTRVRASLRLHPRPTVPIVLGALHPVVILPRAAAQWSEARLRAVLLHELGHVAHHDTRVYPLLSLVAAALWINPVARFALGRFHRESEFAADDAVVRNGMRASSYAAELLGLARLPLIAPSPAIPAPGLGHPALGDRVRRVLSTPSSLVTLRRIVPVTLGAIGAAACIALLRSPVAAAPDPVMIQDQQSEPAAAAWDGPQLPVLPIATPTIALGDHPQLSLSYNILSLSFDGTHTDLELSAVQGQVTPDQVTNHLIGPLYDTLDAGPSPADTPIVLFVEPGMRWTNIVDVLYTAGRAGYRSYAFAVRVGGKVRAMQVGPPRFSTATEDQEIPALHVFWSAQDEFMLEYHPVGFRSAAPQMHCAVPRSHTETLATMAAGACDATGGRAVSLVMQPAPDASLAEVLGVAAAMPRPCGGELVVTSGGDAIATRAPSCTPSEYTQG